MLFSHISDTHLGMEQYGLEERSEDMYNSFDQAIDISIRDHVNFVIFAGDIFHTPNPTGRAVVKFANALKKLKENSIESFFILGEHDFSRLKTTPIHYVYHNLGFAKYVGQGLPVKYKDVLIAGFDKIRPSEMPQYESKFAEINKIANEHQGHKILMMHQGVSEFNKFAGEIQSTDMPANFTYYAMGHLHDKDIRHFNHLGGPIVYPGSTEMSSNEKIKNDIEKGFFVIDISTKEIKTDWIKLNIRPQLAFDTQYDDLEDTVSNIGIKIQDLDRKPIVEIKIQGQGIKADHVHSTISKLDQDVLRCFPHIITEQLDESQVLAGRPAIIDDEMQRLSGNILESKELSEFAIKRLLPALTSGVSNQGVDMIWEEYVRFKDDKIN